MLSNADPIRPPHPLLGSAVADGVAAKNKPKTIRKYKNGGIQKMKKYIKLIALALTAIMTFSLAACSSQTNKENVTEKLLTLSNSSKLHILSITMAPTEAELESDKAINLLGETALNPESALETTVSFPTEAYKGGWFIYVTALDVTSQETYETVTDLGEIFNDDPNLFLDDVYGFEFVFDAEDEEVDVVNLDGTRI